MENLALDNKDKNSEKPVFLKNDQLRPREIVNSTNTRITSATSIDE